jgi:ethanolamine ammonia-lyase small subunit
MDEIARLLDAEAALFVCGERPGLGFSDSLSAYYIYRPGQGATDADREVISNINPRGIEPARAARLTAEAVQRILRDRKSGITL